MTAVPLLEYIVKAWLIGRIFQTQDPSLSTSFGPLGESTGYRMLLIQMSRDSSLKYLLLPPCLGMCSKGHRVLKKLKIDTKLEPCSVPCSLRTGLAR
jgi:hypothetical protein